MLESDVWKSMKPRFNAYGTATRIENVASTSVPDVIFMHDGFITFVELKVDHGGQFSMPKYQHAYGVQIAPHIQRQHHWIALWCEDIQGCRMFTFDRARTMAGKADGDRVYFEWRYVWERMSTHHEIVDMNSFELWVNLLQSFNR